MQAQIKLASTQKMIGLQCPLIRLQFQGRELSFYLFIYLNCVNFEFSTLHVSPCHHYSILHVEIMRPI